MQCRKTSLLGARTLQESTTGFDVARSRESDSGPRMDVSKLHASQNVKLCMFIIRFAEFRMADHMRV